MHIPESGKIQISSKFELCGANKVDIQNQRPRLRRNKLILVGKAEKGKFCKPVPQGLDHSAIQYITIGSNFKANNVYTRTK